MTKIATWKANPDLMTRLVEAQSHFDNIDIMTFAGMCDDRAELLRHVERYEARVVHKAA